MLTVSVNDLIKAWKSTVTRRVPQKGITKLAAYHDYAA